MSERGHNRQARIVVGLDGSDESTEALRWALQECRLRGATLHAVMVWHDPSSYDLGHPYLSDLKQEEQAARARLDETIRAVTDEAEFAAMVRHVVEGEPSLMLCRIAEDADLLVLGARGTGGFASLLRGSVADRCAHHSHVPIVIVPQGRRTSSH